MRIKIYFLIFIMIFSIFSIISCENVKDESRIVTKIESENSIEEMQKSKKDLNPVTIRNLNYYFHYLKYILKIEDISIDGNDNIADIFINNNYAYLIILFDKFFIIDITDKYNPKIISSLDTPGHAESIFVNGNYAYLITFSDGIFIIDITDKYNPKIISSLDTPGHAESIFVNGNYAYLITLSDGIFIIDITDKYNPKIISSLDTPRYTRSVFINGNYAYLADGENGLQILDITDKYNPKIISGLYTPGAEPMSVFVYGNYAYLADGGSGLALIVNVEDKYNPRIVSSLATPDLACKIYADDNYAYLANGKNGLLVFNIEDKNEPFIIEKIPIATGNFFIEDNYAYIVDNWEDLNIVDLINRNYPEVFKSVNIPSGCYEIIDKIEDDIYIIGGIPQFLIINVESLNQPKLNKLDVDNVEAALLDENVIYVVSHYIDSDNKINRYINIFDITNEDEPVSKSRTNIQNKINDIGKNNYDIGKKNNHLILAGNKGLKVFEIVDDYEISHCNNFDIPGTTYNIEIVDNLAFISNSENGLMIIDISDIDNLKTISKIPNVGPSFFIDGNYIYAATNFGLNIIDISDKNNPIIINSIDTIGKPYDIYKANNFVYLSYFYLQNEDTQKTERSDIIQIIDVSNVKNLEIIKNIKIPGTPTSVLVEGDYVYVSAYEVGLLILDIKN